VSSSNRIVTWHAATGVSYAKPGTGNYSRLAKETSTPTRYICVLDVWMPRNIFKRK